MSVVRRDFALFEVWELSFVYDLKNAIFQRVQVEVLKEGIN